MPTIPRSRCRLLAKSKDDKLRNSKFFVFNTLVKSLQKRRLGTRTVDKNNERLTTRR
jgi:hypothetical protein